MRNIEKLKRAYTHPLVGDLSDYLYDQSCVLPRNDFYYLLRDPLGNKLLRQHTTILMELL